MIVCVCVRGKIDKYIRTYECTSYGTYVYTYIHTYVYTYIHTYIHTYIRTHVLPRYGIVDVRACSGT